MHAAVGKKYKVKNYDVLPHDNEKMRQMYYFIGTGTCRDLTWFRPLSEEKPFPEADWNEDVDRQDIDENENMEIENYRTNKTEESMDNEEWAEDCEEEDNRMIKSFKKAAFVLNGKVEKRYECYRQNYKKAITSFKCNKSCIRKGCNFTESFLQFC